VPIAAGHQSFKTNLGQVFFDLFIESVLSFRQKRSGILIARSPLVGDIPQRSNGHPPDAQWVAINRIFVPGFKGFFS